MRAIFGKTITNIVLSDPAVIIVVGDIGFGLFDQIRKERPNQFFNVGTIEQSMIGIAAGMAINGLKPWVYTITPFLIERAFEQVKIDIDANNVDVKLVGYADYPGQGITHANVLDFGKHNPFQNIRCYAPDSSAATEKFILDEYTRPGPCFISLKKDKPCR